MKGVTHSELPGSAASLEKNSITIVSLLAAISLNVSLAHSCNPAFILTQRSPPCKCRSRHPYRKKNGDVFHHEIREYIL